MICSFKCFFYKLFVLLFKISDIWLFEFIMIVFDDSYFSCFDIGKMMMNLIFLIVIMCFFIYILFSNVNKCC